MNLRIGPISHVLSTGYSWCHRCRTTWRFVDGHETYYSLGSACFPLCEKCWVDLATPEARLPYYEQLIREWSEDRTKAMQIREAVMAGL